MQVVGLPDRRWTMVVQGSRRVPNVVHAVLNLSVVLIVLFAASMNVHG